MKEDKLEGKVKSISTLGDDDTRITDVYNEKGYQTEHWFFMPSTILLSRETGLYNDKGQLLEESKFDKGISLVSKTVHGYNAKGVPIGRSLFSYNNSLLEKYIYKYDGAGNMTDSIRMDQFGNVLEKYSMQYDGKGNMTKSVWQWGEDTITAMLEYSYNESGKLIKEKRSGVRGLSYEIYFQYYKNGGLMTEENVSFYKTSETRALLRYDSLGNKISYQYTMNGIMTERSEYAYDREGNMTEEIKLDSTGKAYMNIIHTYNEKNNEIELKRYSPLDVLNLTVTWKYEYDKNGNWVNKTQLINGQPGESKRREIEYY